jgi:Holliday junction resolvase RusA-like endonuclease
MLETIFIFKGCVILKSRKQKQLEYEEKFSDIPKDYTERLLWMYDKYNINDKKAENIIAKRNAMVQSLEYGDLFIILYENPEGSPRPRFRLVNRKNFINEAMTNGQFVHVYSITGKEDNMFMKRLIDNDLIAISNMIFTPCIVEYNAYLKTPSTFNAEDKFLAEIGLIRPITKPDWDNLGKKYSDMSNHNLWLDDTLVISGTVNKFYSILPRIEIKLRFLNMLYNKYQYKSISNKVEDEVKYFDG